MGGTRGVRNPRGLHGVEQRAVRIEKAVLDNERDLVPTARQAEGILVLVANQVQPAPKSGVDVQPRDSERVVVVQSVVACLIVRIVIGLAS